VYSRSGASAASRNSEGIVLLRDGIAALLENGTRLRITHLMMSLAEALEREGAVVDALETVEQAVQANPSELFYRPETIKLRGELRLVHWRERSRSR
jgi:hypothetical protein